MYVHTSEANLRRGKDLTRKEPHTERIYIRTKKEWITHRETLNTERSYTWRGLRWQEFIYKSYTRGIVTYQKELPFLDNEES